MFCIVAKARFLSLKKNQGQKDRKGPDLDVELFNFPVVMKPGLKT